MHLSYRNRAEAARVLAQLLQGYADRGDVLVLGLPRGGVPVAAEIASALRAELDVMVVRKVGVPGWEELAMGAVAMGGVRVENPGVVRETSEVLFDSVAEREMLEVERRVRAYRGDRPLPVMRGRTVILVDDGLATGATMRAAVQAVREQEPARVVVAVPVAPASTIEDLAREADDIVCPFVPEGFLAIGQFYADFSQVDDEEVKLLLERARIRGGRSRLEEIEIEIGPTALEGTLALPRGAAGIVLFAHGSGSSRKSPRNQAVARALEDAGLATLLFDLLTREEEAIDARTRELRFDIELLAERLTGAIDWVKEQEVIGSLGIGLFGASTGAAAALVAAARRPGMIDAVVSRGGRPDLAEARLAEVRAPTLMIVGGDDEVVLELNRRAAAQMSGEVKVEVIPGATHLFEEPGKLEEVSTLAREWFERHLVRDERGASSEAVHAL